MQLRIIAEPLGKGGTQTTTKFLKAVEKGFEQKACDGPSLGHLVPIFGALVHLLKQVGAKQGSVADLELLLDLARRHGEVSLKNFESSAERSVASASRRNARPGATAVDTNKLIENYVQKLEATLGNDAQFRAVYRELSDDEQVSNTGAVEIASRFFEPMARSSSRPRRFSTAARS